MIKIDFPLEYQRALIYANLESLSPSSTLNEISTGSLDKNESTWKHAVAKFISLNLRAKLIEGFPAHNPQFNYDDIDEVERVLINSEPLRDVEIWMGMQFSGTSRLNELLSEFRLTRKLVKL